MSSLLQPGIIAPTFAVQSLDLWFARMRVRNSSHRRIVRGPAQFGETFFSQGPDQALAGRTHSFQPL